MANMAFADAVITIDTAISPNAFLSASYPAFQNNAIKALLTGSQTAGTPGTPSFFQAMSNFSVVDYIATDFPSWLGQAPPVGAAFQNEFGNRIVFATLVKDSLGAKINVASGLSVNVPAFGDNPGFSGTTFMYTPFTVGITLTGGGNFTTQTSGTGLVDAIATFPAFGFAASSSDPLGATQANITDLEFAIQQNPGNLTFMDTTTFGGNTGTATVNVTPIPEPTSLTLLGSGLLVGLGMLRRRRAA